MDYGRAWRGEARQGLAGHGKEYGAAGPGTAGQGTARNKDGHIRKHNKPKQQHGQRITTL
jgi:hypothetical protein